MNLSPEQKKAVSQWLAAGASIAEVQKRLREEFQLSLTYIDTRFLIDDLGLNVKAAAAPRTGTPDLGVAKPKGAPAGAAPAGPVADANAELLDEDDAFEGADEFADGAAAAAPAGASSVKVDIDRITRPGTVVSGTVTFGDGNSGKWALDQVGRLVFEGSKPNYRPSQTDLQQFQRELSAQLQRHGY